MKLKSIATATSFAVAALCSGAAFAYEAGDIIVRAGLTNVNPDESSGGLVIPALDGVNGFDGTSEISGTSVEVDDDTQLGLNALYMVTNSVGIELLAATPFKHDITANLGGLGKVDAGSTKQLPPTLSVVWYPLTGNGSAIQPYLGAGVNYTVFFSEDISSDLEAGLSGVADVLTGTSVGLPSPMPLNLKLDDSWGLAAQVGVDFALNEQWHINASVRWIDIETEAKISSGGTTIITVDDIQIDPYVYSLTVGYKF